MAQLGSRLFFLDVSERKEPEAKPDIKKMLECNAPHLSSGDERSAVAMLVFPLKRPGRFIAQG
jgi:hypothetical protein